MKIIQNKVYIISLILVGIIYISRINYIKEIMFKTTNTLTVKQYLLLALIIAGVTIFTGTILFILIRFCFFIFKKVTLPALKKLYNMFK
ncbi:MULTISPECIES: hypothetical protein [Clostridium]|uniref:Uncharacterized protein n=1 Tax=Clostridium botulinum TaxID=1491 RepID=A0A6B4QPW7_CLOBO|nr:MULTISPECIES: hypothetical protein [Clostridium]MBN1037092.1 hypothetical protein [Clostridium botulinum]MBY6810160.1 hypothetical protein [Clostridium botulinum]MBY6823484.1 hypothetical protein [Clostridium botulinum]MBY6834020.1 hypothetical protein [Clostridium botulinum]MBY6972367.1 hypothetical protein [Clostridium botulinum]